MATNLPDPLIHSKTGKASIQLLKSPKKTLAKVWAILVHCIYDAISLDWIRFSENDIEQSENYDRIDDQYKLTHMYTYLCIIVIIIVIEIYSRINVTKYCIHLVLIKERKKKKS